MAQPDLEIIEEEQGYRINLPVQEGDTERYIFQNKELSLNPQLNTVRTGVSCPSYRKFDGNWESYHAGLGRTFEPGSLEHTAFEMMQSHVRELRKTA